MKSRTALLSLSLLLAATAFADQAALPHNPRIAPASAKPVPVKAPSPAVAGVSPAAKAALNPQPLPPKVSGTTNAAGAPGVKNSLNPQPLPPKIGTTAQPATAPRVASGPSTQP